MISAPKTSRIRIGLQTILTLFYFVSLTLNGCSLVQPQRAPQRLAYTIQPASEWAFAEKEEEMDITIPAFDPLTGAGVSDQIKARFRGQDRKGPKTSIADAEIENFENLRSLIASLPSDDDMRNHEPPVEKDSMSRFAEERRNVRVAAWIYAIKYEADQDWHVIIGTDPSTTSKTFFNAEVSGLPSQSSAAFETLLKVRQQLANILDNDLPQEGSYRKYEDPIPVLIGGSLFYDIDHAPGIVGPTGMRPRTAWEIHPITSLDLKQ
jgi:hypothetical protein